MAELAVDLGTWSVAALLVDQQGRRRRLVPDPETGQVWSRSALGRDATGTWLLGAAAEDLREGEPERFRDDLKRLLAFDAPVQLGDSSYPVSALLGRVVARCVEHARPMTDEPIDRLTLGAPATFEGHRSEALRAAGRFAGFTPERITLVPEPVAAARAALGPKPPDGRWLIVDLGGGTLDLALVRTEKDETSVVDAAGSDLVGGFLVDEAVAEHLRTAYDLPQPGADNHAEEVELLAAAQLMKHRLTASESVKATNPYPGPHRKLTLDRARLRELVKPVAEAIVDHCVALLGTHGLTWSDITAIVATGGATRSPTIADQLGVHAPVHQPVDLPELTTVHGLVPPPGRRRPAGTTALATIGSLACLYTVTGDSRGTNDVAFSGRGTLLAAAGADCAVRVWNARTGQAHVTLDGHANVVRGVAFSADGGLLAAANGNSVRLWRVRSLSHIETLRGHTSTVVAVTFNPQGNRIATASADGSVRIWTSDGGRCSDGILRGSGDPLCLAYSPDGDLLAVGGSSGEIRMWNLRAGSSRVLAGHRQRVNALAFSPDGLHVASAGADRAVSLWSVPTGKQVRALDDHRVPVTGVAWSPDGTLLATTSEDDALRLCNPATGKVRRTIDVDPTPSSVAYSADGTSLVVAGSNRRLGLWGAV